MWQLLLRYLIDAESSWVLLGLLGVAVEILDVTCRSSWCCRSDALGSWVLQGALSVAMATFVLPMVMPGIAGVIECYWVLQGALRVSGILDVSGSNESFLRG